MRVELFVSCILIFLLCGNCIAGTKGTIEGDLLTRTAYAIQHYVILHNERPSNWAQIDSLMDIDKENRFLQKEFGFRFQDRYQFMAGKVPLLDRVDCEIVMIRIVPVKDRKWSSKLSRPLIYRDADGRFSSATFSEAHIVRALKSAGYRVEVPADLPAAEVNRLGTNVVPGWLLGGAILLSGGILMFAMKCWSKKRQITV